jgi:phosphatidylserine/phosphatidylglycerophosphate/cardiolipin synthase-like enzyme
MTYTGVMERTESPAAAVTTPLHGEVVRRTPVRTHAGIAQRTVYGWGRYYRQVRQLPLDQRRALLEVGEAIKQSFQHGRTVVRTVQVEGHADHDTPRNRLRERQISVERAEAVAAWLKAYVGAHIAGAITWTIRGLGASRLSAAPTSERNRRQNRRVEILLLTRPPAPICTVPASRNRALTVWMQTALNQSLQIRLQPSGVIGRDTRSALRHYQQQRRVRPSGLLDPATARALQGDGNEPPPCEPSRWYSVLPNGTDGNQVSYLIRGAATFKEMADAIKTAKDRGHYIYLLGWWLSDNIRLDAGDPASSIVSLFNTASRRGVQIRAMLWDQCGTHNSDETARINALATGGAVLDDATLTFGSHHQKVVLVKGEQGLIAFCGGIDINVDRIRTVSPSIDPRSFYCGSGGGLGSPLHDVHCRIRGPAAHDLLQVFLWRWYAQPKAREIDRVKGSPLGLCEVRIAVGNQYVQIATTFNRVRPAKCAESRGVRDTMISLIRAAQLSIYIEDQYLVNMEAATELFNRLPFIQWLKIVIPHSSISDLPEVWQRRKLFVDKLRSSPFRSKVEVSYLRNPDGKFGPFTYVHSKTWIIDGEVAVIGSANCNRRGWSHDSEVIAAIYHPEMAAALQRDLMALNLGRLVAYNPNEGRDKRTLFSWDHMVDPNEGEGISVCAAPALPSCPAIRAARVRGRSVGAYAIA